MQEEKVNTHPSYVLVGLNRCSGSGGKFFGSSVSTHSFIRLRIKTGVVHRSLSNDYYMGDKTVIEVDFTPNQFAELITSMNVGDGVPGTARYFFPENLPQGKIENPPVMSKTEEFRQEINLVPQEIEGLFGALEKELKDLNLSKKKEENILRSVSSIHGKIRENMPFILDQAYEALEKTVVEAKAAVDSWYTHLLVRMGLKTLEENSGKVELLEDLGEKKE